jgi:hypothetical protein
MTTFNLIIKKIVNLDNNIFSYKYDENDTIAGIHKIFFNILHMIELNRDKSKIWFLNETINNYYFSEKVSEKNEFLNLFNKIQKTYHVLNRFVYLYKVKRSKLIVDIDMQLNKINIGDSNVICIYHVNSKYLFKIDDLLKMIYMSLTNCFSFFAEPIPIKNPYNNISFGKSILYYIYCYLISSAKIKHVKPEYLDIFFKFKESNFDMTKFVNSYEYILREYSIKNYLNNTTKTVILGQIFRMIDIYNSTLKSNKKKILIDEEFPDEELISIMKPYLYLNLKGQYSLISKVRNMSRIKLYKKLREFQQFNPIFGRKIIKFKDIIHKGKTKRIKSHIGFSMKHKSFDIYNIDNFMNNHLAYKYDQNEENYNDDEDVVYQEDQDSDYDTDETINNIRYLLAEMRVVNNNEREEEEQQEIQEEEGEEDDEEDCEEGYGEDQEGEDQEGEDQEDEEEYNDSVS